MDVLILLIVAACFSKTVALKVPGEEPCCSRVECEYNVLKRMVELEHTTKLLADKVEEQENEINRLKKKEPFAVIAEVQLPTKQTFTAGDTIIFTRPIANIGEAYNTHFGFFEPPLNGTYIFSVSLCTSKNTWINLGIMRDTEVLKEHIVGDSSWHTCGSATSVTYVTTKNKIWVKVLRTENGIIDVVHGISAFVGALMNTSPP